MLDFMVVSLPRSGSTWAANWLSTAHVHCAHDPLYTTHFRDFDTEICKQAGDRVAGVACTGIGWLWPEWVNRHPCRKLVLHRPIEEVQRSLGAAGWPHVPGTAPARLDTIAGWHVDWTDIFDPETAAPIWRYLTGLEFDADRHADLVKMQIQPRLDLLVADPAVEDALLREIA